METTHTDAISRRSDSHALVYWRPGCPFCERLFSGLDAGDERISRVNIWEDPEAAAFVRSLQKGNEVVPTVVVGEKVLTAPDADELLALLG